MTQDPRYTPPDNPDDAYFDPPTPERAAQLCAALLKERNNRWRTPRHYTSMPESDGPDVTDPAPGAPTRWEHWIMTITGLDLYHEEYLVVPTGSTRTAHTGLVSSSFGFHPLFGTGHTLRTDGLLALFWNGEEVTIVEAKNVTPLRVVLATAKPPTLRERRAALLASI